MKEGNDGPDAMDSPTGEEWEILARHFAGEASAEESAQVEAILSRHPGEREALVALGRMTNRYAAAVPVEIDTEVALEKVRSRRPYGPVRSIDVKMAPKRKPDVGTRTRWRVPSPAIAAAALLAIGLGSWLALGDRLTEQAVAPSNRMVATGVGVRDSMDLPDGSRVVLGPLSSINIAAGFGADSRDLTINGSAWFDVVHDDTRPFTVHAGEAQILDIGTKFAVRSDAPGGVAVTVSEGSVSLRQANTQIAQGIILKAGDNGLVRKGGEVVVRRGSATDDDTAWLRGRLVFRDASIDEIQTSLRRWYGIDLQVTDSAIGEKRLTASFAGESPDRVLEVLRLALGAEIVRRGDTAIVRSSPGRTRLR